MISITKNESRVIDFLLRNFADRYSINQVAKRLELSPRGAYKILKKLEDSKIIKAERIGNAIYYHINFKNELALKASELVLVQNKLTPYLKVQAEDLELLKEQVSCCILFGSILSKEKQASDIDILLVFEKENYKQVQNKIKELSKLKPKKMHLIQQTRDDLIKSLGKKDRVILDIIKNGKILWGQELVVEAIKNAC